jgi:hypothetical protein
MTLDNSATLSVAKNRLRKETWRAFGGLFGGLYNIQFQKMLKIKHAPNISRRTITGANYPSEQNLSTSK